MRDSIVTKGRLTVMMPVVPTYDTRVDHLDKLIKSKAVEEINVVGRQLVHQILVRKGMSYLMDRNGTRFRPIAQTIFNVNMQRLASNETPESIVNDLRVQLKLVKGL